MNGGRLKREERNGDGTRGRSRQVMCRLRGQTTPTHKGNTENEQQQDRRRLHNLVVDVGLYTDKMLILLYRGQC